MIRSLYSAILGQAIQPAIGRYLLAATVVRIYWVSNLGLCNQPVVAILGSCRQIVLRLQSFLPFVRIDGDLWQGNCADAGLRLRLLKHVAALTPRVRLNDGNRHGFEVYIPQRRAIASPLRSPQVAASKITM